MKPSPYLFLAALLVFAPAAPAFAAPLPTSSTILDTSGPDVTEPASTKFDPVIDDLPLMEGLTPVADQGTLFTTPQGRIADSVAIGIVDVDQVYMFYRRSLPHLGWQKVNARTFRRKGEKLVIEAKGDGKITTVRFSLKPE